MAAVYKEEERLFHVKSFLDRKKIEGSRLTRESYANENSIKTSTFETWLSRYTDRIVSSGIDTSRAFVKIERASATQSNAHFAKIEYKGAIITISTTQIGSIIEALSRA